MNGWAPFDVDGWPETVELLDASGRRWPDGAAIYDLRWHVDQGEPLKGRNALAKRWRWKPHEVRELLADTDRWWDPSKGDAPTSREDLEARTPVVRRKARPTPECPEPAQRAPERQRSKRQNGDESARSAPGARHTRGDRSPSPAPERSIPPDPRSAGELPVEHVEPVDDQDDGTADRRPNERAVQREARVEYIADRIARELDDLDQDDPDAAERFAGRCERAEGAQVDHVTALCRPRERIVHGTKVKARDWPDAPNGIRKADVADGLRRAASRWRAARSERAPPDIGREFAHVLDRHLEPGAPP